MRKNAYSNLGVCKLTKPSFMQNINKASQMQMHVRIPSWLKLGNHNMAHKVRKARADQQITETYNLFSLSNHSFSNVPSTPAWSTLKRGNSIRKGKCSTERFIMLKRQIIPLPNECNCSCIKYENNVTPWLSQGLTNPKYQSCPKCQNCHKCQSCHNRPDENHSWFLLEWSSNATLLEPGLIIHVNITICVWWWYNLTNVSDITKVAKFADETCETHWWHFTHQVLHPRNSLSASPGTL